MFWRVFDGEFSDAEVVHKEGIEGKSFSLEFSHAMGLAMWALYQGLTVILLINILIALMNSTYMKVWENADMEWKYSKSFYQIQFLHPRAVFPPPFRWFYYFAKYMRKIKKWLKKVNNQEGENQECMDQESKKVKYL